MKWIKYEYICGINPEDGSDVFAKKRIGYSEANLAIAQGEAYRGEYTIEEDGKEYPSSATIPADADMQGNKITNLGNAASDTDAVNLGQVKQIVKTATPEVDNTLSASGKPADAKATGDKIATFMAMIAGTARVYPEFVNSVDECTDTSKLYVLPDGFIYAYMKTEVQLEGGIKYTNLLLTKSYDADRKTLFNGKGYKTGVRLSGSSGAESDSTNNKNQGISGFIIAKPGDKLYMTNFEGPSGVASYIIGYNDSNAVTGNVQNAPWMVNTEYPDYVEYELTSSVLGNFTAIRLCQNGLDGDTIVTLNEEIKVTPGETVIQFAWANTGHAFVPAEYDDIIAELQAKQIENDEDIAALKEANDNKIPDVESKPLLFISPDGNDSNNGLSALTPKKTVKACIRAGAIRISAKRGVYKENFTFTNVRELEIFPTDNDKTHVLGEPREPIVFEMTDEFVPSNFATYNSIKRVAYSNSENTQFDKVFVKKSQPGKVEESGYGSRYNATVWLMSDDYKTVCNKLKPVLTIAECEAEVNTFTYVGGYIYINASWTGVTKVIIPTNWGNGIHVENAASFILKEVEVRFAGGYNINMKNCAYFDFYKCACKFTSYGSGFHPLNSNGVFTACYATKNYDGYGVSGYGHTTYIDCVSEFNFDDGVSHHNATEGTFIGGRYEGNGKGGNTPAYGAKVNIYGGIYKDNASFGIGYLYASGSGAASGMVQGAVMVGNPIGLAVNANCPVTAINCIYKNNTQDKDLKGNVTEY